MNDEQQALASSFSELISKGSSLERVREPEPDDSERAVTDVAWNAEAKALFQEVRRFLDEHRYSELGDRPYESGVSHDEDFVRALGAQNWIVPAWPRAGFGPLGAEEMHVLTDELTRADAPICGGSTSMMMARVVQAVGREHLVVDMLPKVVAGEGCIALGMGEPEAGSDVAPVQTRAHLIDGGWVIDGQRMFTTNGHIADYVFIPVRTDPDSVRRRGLATFLIPMGLEGIEAQGACTLSGERTNITFYSDVMVKDRWRISDVGAGWRSIMVALQDDPSAPFSSHVGRLLDLAEAWAEPPSVQGFASIERDHDLCGDQRGSAQHHRPVRLQAPKSMMADQHAFTDLMHHPVATGAR